MITYIILIVTFALLGILSLLKGVKEGIIASGVAVVITAVIGLIHFIVSKVNGFLGKYQITMMDFFTWLFIIALGIIVFVTLSFIIKLNGNKHAKISSKSKKWRK